MNSDSGQVYYKLSEISKLLGVETSVLRFWEKEFPLIKPMKIGPRKRLYRPKDYALFLEIKYLLYEELFTIAGAKKRIEKNAEEAINSLSGRDECESKVLWRSNAPVGHGHEQSLIFNENSRCNSNTNNKDCISLRNDLEASRQNLQEVRQALEELREMIKN